MRGLGKYIKKFKKGERKYLLIACLCGMFGRNYERDGLLSV